MRLRLPQSSTNSQLFNDVLRPEHVRPREADAERAWRNERRILRKRRDLGRERSSRYEDGCALEPASAEGAQGLVGAGERVGCRPGHDSDLGHEPKKLDSVAPREIRDRYQLALLPQERVGKRGDVAHVDSGADHAAPLADRFQRDRDEVSVRRVDDRRIERPRRPLARSAGPRRAEAPREGFALRDRRGA